MSGQKRKMWYQHKTSRILLILVSVIVLLAVYLFQRVDYHHYLSAVIGMSGEASPNVVFIVNRTVRLILNDLACLALILAIFQEKKYLNVAMYVFLVEVLIILPAYFYIKLTTEGDSEISSPLLSQVHRMIVNPMLMILLMVGFFYQKLRVKNKTV